MGNRLGLRSQAIGINLPAALKIVKNFWVRVDGRDPKIKEDCIVVFDDSERYFCVRIELLF
jgi:hypothetical protein